MSFKSFVFIFSVCLCCVLLPVRTVQAFGCTPSSQSYTVASGLFSVTKSAFSITLTPVASTSCSGDWGREYNDALRIKSISMHASLAGANFIGEIKIGGVAYTFDDAIGKCIWPNTSCSVHSNQNQNNTYSTSGMTVNVSRAGGDGYSLGSNEALVTIYTSQRSRGGWGTNGPTFTYKLNGNITSSYTCDVKNYTANVALPKVTLGELKSFGTGRYSDVTQPFSLNLECAPDTQVNITLSGDVLTGTDDVLKNQISGNNNVGVQLLLNDSAIKIGDSLELIHRAQSSESLVFNAYYYYKGGEVNAGIIKSLATFTLDYK